MLLFNIFHCKKMLWKDLISCFLAVVTKLVIYGNIPDTLYFTNLTFNRIQKSELQLHQCCHQSEHVNNFMQPSVLSQKNNFMLLLWNWKMIKNWQLFCNLIWIAETLLNVVCLGYRKSSLNKMSSHKKKHHILVYNTRFNIENRPKIDRLSQSPKP